MDVDGLAETRAADQLAALGNETRLRLFRQLVRTGPEGLSVSALQDRLAIPASTLAHHLGALVSAGLVRQSRHGREVRSVLDYEVVSGLIGYLTEACCAESVAGPHDPPLVHPRQRENVT